MGTWNGWQKGNSYFNEGTMRSLFIFFDLIIVNDLSIEEDDEM